MGQEGVGEFIRGGSLQKRISLKLVGCIHYGQIYTYYGHTPIKRKYSYPKGWQKCRKAQQGNLVIATTSENDEDVCKAVAWLGKEDIAVSSDACIYKHRMNLNMFHISFKLSSFSNRRKSILQELKSAS
jgi:type I restriction enzyme S subunit